MEIIIEMLLQFLGECLLQAVMEALAELGVRIVGPSRDRMPVSAWLAALGYLVLGCVAGGISLLVFPSHFIHVQWLKWLSLVLVPVGAGLVMSRIGKLRRRQGKELIRLDSFVYGFLFALAMALIRFWFGR